MVLDELIQVSDSNGTDSGGHRLCLRSCRMLDLSTKSWELHIGSCPSSFLKSPVDCFCGPMPPIQMLGNTWSSSNGRRPANNALNLTVRPVTRLDGLNQVRASTGRAQGARPSRPAG